MREFPNHFPTHPTRGLSVIVAAVAAGIPSCPSPPPLFIIPPFPEASCRGHSIG